MTTSSMPVPTPVPTNKAAFLVEKNNAIFQVRNAPYPRASANTIVVKNAALAINPIDWILPSTGKADFIYTWLKYPFIMGFDVAGQVVDVGKDVNVHGSRFEIGDRVLGFAAGSDETINDAAEGGFQEYTVLRPDLTSYIPDGMSYESACVIPLGLGTAAAGLFQKDQLGLPLSLPSSSVGMSKSTGKTLIVWGGSTSVGCNAIQLAVAAGYSVVTTSSPKNFDLLKSLGATHVFDYRSPTVVPDMLAVLKGKLTAGALTMSSGGAEACMEILSKCKGNKVISMAAYPEPPEACAKSTVRSLVFYASWMASFKVKGALKGVRSNFINCSTIARNEVGRAVFAEFLPKALEEGLFVPAPRAEVVGTGIEAIQKACEIQKKGVSAMKVVVTL